MTDIISGCANRGLHIDLNVSKATIFEISADDRRRYLGGKGLALKLLADYLPPDCEPLDPENVFVLAMGVYMGSGAPCSGRFAAASLSPLTGLVNTSSCGGPFGMAFKTAGYDVLVISGRAAEPAALMIDQDGVQFEDGAHLWGLETGAAQEALDLGRKDGALVIGPAGENLVRFANVVSGGRFLGRGGLGAVMGAKNLKAVAARGGAYAIKPVDEAGYKRVLETARRRIKRSAFIEEYRNYGTAANVEYCQRGGILPVDNFRRGRHDDAAALFGEAIAEGHQTRYDTCKPCSILCGHRSTLPDGTRLKTPEYESIALLGSNTGNFDPDMIARWDHLCGSYGLDTISTGSVLAYLMEAGEQGLIDTELHFGSPQGVAEMIENIAQRRGLGDALANGVRWLGEQYGGVEFALHVKGMEFSGYDPRGSWGQGLSYAVANRGACHLSATLMTLEVFDGLLKPNTARAKAAYTNFIENLYAAVNSLQSCMFTASGLIMESPLVGMTPRPILAFLMQYLHPAALAVMDISLYQRFFTTITGIKLTRKTFLMAGERAHTLERLMNTRRGVDRSVDTLPGRLLNEAQQDDPTHANIPLETMLDDYYRHKGYDANGIPTPETLARLGIGLVLEPLPQPLS